MSSPFSCEAVDLLEKVGVKTYKIPSGEVTNIPLLEKIAQTKKHVLLSSGMSSWGELDLAVATLQKFGCKKLTVMQCVSKYPCPAEEAGLHCLREMKERYQLPIGYSDHTFGSAIPIAAVALGAVVVEKHITLSRNTYGSDAKHSTEPIEFKHMVDEIRRLECALNNNCDKDNNAAALKNMKHIFEKSIVSACAIEAGTILTREMLAFKKPGSGIAPKEYATLLGKKALKRIGKNSAITWDDCE